MKALRERAGGLATAALVVVIGGLAGTAGWAALEIERSSVRVRAATQSMIALESVQRAVAAQAFAEAGYRRAPSVESRLEIERAVAGVADAVLDAQAVASRSEAVMLSRLQLVNDRYAREVRSSLDTPPTAVGDRVAGPALVAIQELIDAATATRTAEVSRAVDEQRSIAHRVEIVVPLVFAAGFLVVIACWAVLLRWGARLSVKAGEAEQSRDTAVAEAAATSIFLATMSHEIRTPMNAVIGAARLLEQSELDAGQRELVAMLRSSGDGLLQVINDVLDYSKIEAGELQIDPQPFDLVDLLDDVVATVAPAAVAKGIEVVGSVDPPSPDELVADAGRLRQVLINLVGNAVKFTDAGEVVVEVGGTRGPAGDATLTMRVRDTGIGIREEALPDLFTAFRQIDATTSRAHGGTGLGLAICARLVEAMGGTIAVASVFGAGSSFEVTLPVGSTATTRARPFAGRTALVLDAAGSRRDALVAHLERLGLRSVLTAARGSDLPDLVILAAQEQVPDLPNIDKIPWVALGGVGDAPPPGFVGVLSLPVRSCVAAAVLARALGRADADVEPVGVDADRSVLRVLYAEDNAVNQRIGALLLANLGCHDVDIVDSGAAALVAVQEQRYDLVLMDVQMPGMDGLETTRRLRRLDLPHPQPQVVALTAGALATEREACAAAGMDGYLAKPVQMSALRDTLRAVPAQRRPPEPAPAEPAPADSAVDGRVLADLFETAGVPEDRRQDLLDAFVSDTDERLVVLTADCAAGRHAGVAAVAHELKSTCAMFGASRMAALLAELEVAARDAHADLAGTCELVRAEYAAVRPALVS